MGQDVEHDTMLIDRSPQIMLLAVDPQEHLVQAPGVAGFGGRRSSAKACSNFTHQCRMLS